MTSTIPVSLKHEHFHPLDLAMFPVCKLRFRSRDRGGTAIGDSSILSDYYELMGKTDILFTAKLNALLCSNLALFPICLCLSISESIVLQRL